MKNWYQKVIVPRLLNFEMASQDLEKVRKEVLTDASGVVLEIGVGPGYNIPLYKNISELHALEPFQELIDIAQTRTGNLCFPVHFLKSGAEDIPLPDNSVDTVVSTWTLCSVEKTDKVLDEIKRVLRTGGRLLFVEHGASPQKYVYLIQKVLTPITKNFTGNCHYDRKIESAIARAGFILQRIKYSTERGRPLIYNYQGVASVNKNS